MATPQSSAELVSALSALNPNTPAAPEAPAKTATEGTPAVGTAEATPATATAVTAATAVVAPPVAAPPVVVPPAVAPVVSEEDLLKLQLASVEATKAYIAAPTDMALKSALDSALKAVNDFVTKGTAAATLQDVSQKVELQVGKDGIVEQAVVTQLESFARKHNFSQPQAEALLASERDRILEGRARASEFQKRFMDTIQSDPELGGTAEQVNSKLAKADLGMRHAFTESELLELKKLGLDKAPAIVRASLRLYNMALASPNLVMGSPAATMPQKLNVNNPDELAQAVAQSRARAKT